jgi:poly-beta-1,6-N-acetyl-D-glucosamine synthase
LTHLEQSPVEDEQVVLQPMEDLVLPHQKTVGLTIIVPAYNEAESIADTIRALQAQTVDIESIVVVDDCSTDGTGYIARSLGVDVLTAETNTGSKAGAQNLALAQTTTPYVMAVDADTVLAPDAVERVLTKLRSDHAIAAVCGYVVPQKIRTIWERGRYVEYLYSFSFAKRVQEVYRRPLISSGCFSVYRTEILQGVGGWSTRTITEDMDLTWTFYSMGKSVHFVPEAVSYPVEPTDFTLMRKQLKRWSHGFWQNVKLHRSDVLDSPMLASTVAVVVWDALIASLIYLLAIPVLAITTTPWFLLAYLIDSPIMLVPVLADAVSRRETGKALVSIPAFLVLRMVNVVVMWKAFLFEIVLRRSFTTYEKGH